MEAKDFYTIADNNVLKFAEQTDLSDDEKWLIALGGVFSSLAGDYVNSIDTGRSNQEIRESLRKNWLINERAAFEQAALRLAIGEKRDLYQARLKMLRRFFDFFDNSNVVIKSIAKFSPLLALDWYQTRTKEDLRKVAREELELDRRAKSGNKKSEELFKLLKNASEWRKQLDKVEIGDYHQINDLVAWDAVCLVNLVRCATQIHFIDRTEFVKYAGTIKKQVQAAYSSWDEAALAYLMGTFLWQYSESKAKTVIRTTCQYLEDPRTLVHSVKFK